MKKLLIASLIFISAQYASAQNSISLSGKWGFAIDSLDVGIREKWFEKTFKETVNLPGSMAENGKGNDITVNTQWTGSLFDSSYYKDSFYAHYRKPGNIKVPFFLQPVKEYVGAAWYQREIHIPKKMSEKIFELFLERCHWETQVWIDDNYIGMQNSLGAPHVYDLAGILTPGLHVITVRVDNRIKDFNPGINSSSLTDHSQTNWNGIIGRMELTARDNIYIDDIKTFADINRREAIFEIKIINLNDDNRKIDLLIDAALKDYIKMWNTPGEIKKEVELKPGKNTITIEYPFGGKVFLWDEFTPDTYWMHIELTGKDAHDEKYERFAFRKLGVQGTQFTINDRLLFLRGTLECAVFPKTGYPPMDAAEWRRIFQKCKEYGLNHMRFHSWCPPEAAFDAADELGFYLYVECSSWANFGSSLGDGKPIDKYIMDESERIIKAYGNHPSFCFMTYGNEPAGDNHQKYLTEFVSHWKSKDSRRLYSGATGWPQLEVNDFHSMYEPRIQLWGANLNGIINSKPPSSDYDWTNIISGRGKPVISHEIGQWCAYPNFKEIPKYDGLLKANNFEIFRQNLKDNGMAHLAEDFLFASGKLQVLCYKAEIEAALRTKDFGGFQLLDLHDFPGQGTALIGVLDAFWQEKGYVTAQEYTQFCNTTVPLARMSKFIFNSAENLTASIEVASFEQTPLSGVTPVWQIIDTRGTVLAKGSLPQTDIPAGNAFKLGEISYPLSSLKAPEMYTLVVNVGRFINKWDFWVYPSEIKEALAKDSIRIVSKLDDETVNYINSGGMVLLTPVKGSIKPEKGGNIAVGFSSIFWNTAWTLKQAPHTLGILCDPEHPMLKEFPTQYHSNYQWRDAMMNSNAILLNELGKNFQPVVRIIDDWFTNRPLGLITEAKIGKGKIVFTGIDLLTDAANRPEARQLTHSILQYMRSEEFNPAQEVKPENIKNLLSNNNTEDTMSGNEKPEALHAGAVEIEKAIREYYPETDPAVLKKLEDWQNLKFGLLMHWAPSSQWGIVESWSLCSEDEEWCKRNIEDYDEYKRRYEELKKTFNPVKFDPAKWAKAAEEAGMKYVVFTTKHHDGFCMYDSKFTDYKITDKECPFSSNPKANIAKEIFNEFRKKEFMIGAYFSKPDWHSKYFWNPMFATPDRNANYEIKKHPEWWKKFTEFTHNQIDELLTDYGKIDILWFDGCWVRYYSDEDLANERKNVNYNIYRIQNQDINMPLIAANARKKQPGIIVVDRAVPGKQQNYLTPENQVPEETLPYPWETCMPMTPSWSYEPGLQYKSARRLIHTLVDVVAKGGNFLLNAAPTAEGEWEPDAYDRLQQIGAWMKVNGEAIYNSRPVLPYKEEKICFTQLNDGTVYAIYLADENEKSLPMKLVLNKFSLTPGMTVELLGTGRQLQWQKKGSSCEIEIPPSIGANPPCRYAWTLKISAK